MALRESKRHRDKRPFIPFGDMMLPVIGFVAVGLLVAGIKLFFLSGPKPQNYESVAIAEQKLHTTNVLFPTMRNGSLSTDKQPVFSTVTPPIPSLSPAQKENTALPLSALAVPYSKSGKQESDKVRMDEDASIKTNTVQRKRNSKSSAAQTRKIGDVPIVANNAKEKKNVAPVSPSRTKNEEKQSAKSQVTAQWGVQVGSFTEKDVAQSVQAKVRKKGRNTIVTSAVVHEKKHYRVIVVCGSERKSAEKQAQVLMREGYPILVVPIK
jgi:cell division protein FtsN